ncbi:hypothetical protein KCU81_g435, partial [Aureobasidium melanogenum]
MAARRARQEQRLSLRKWAAAGFEACASRKPLHQAVLMDELDAATALAGVEEWFGSRTLATTYPAWSNCGSFMMSGEDAGSVADIL